MYSSFPGCSNACDKIVVLESAGNRSSSKMEELLPSQVPLKKRKIEAQSPDQRSSCRQVPVSLLSSAKLLLQIPPNTNTSLPVWECVGSAQAEVLWSVTPHGITVQITPKKAQISDQPVTQPASLCEAQLSTFSVPASLPIPSIQSLSQSIFMTPYCRAPRPYRIIPTHPQPLLSSPNQTLRLTTPLTTSQLQPFPQYQAHSQPAPSYEDYITGSSEDTYEVTDLLFQPAPKAKWVQQACFHTVPSEEACICDQFLLGHCRNGFDCKLHHTPYPFHWQLRRQDTHQWVSTSHPAQVKLEKLYCHRKRDTIILQDLADVFTLQFDTMTVEDSEKYDKARRLSNSSNPERNPHFPTVWNHYWWNEYKWEKYSNEVSLLLLEKMKARQSSCRFHIGKQEYEVDFSSLTQRNLTTAFKRKVRRRPTFRSPFSLKSLKTVVLCEATKKFGQGLPSLTVDPLQKFSSWYPPVWTLSPDQGFSLVEVPPSAKAYQSIHCLFYSTMSETKLEILSIQQVQNMFQWDKYRRQKEHMQSRSTAQNGSLERHLFHGTTEDSAKEICLNNFDPRVSGKNGVAYGQGSYFARDASYSDTYAHTSDEENCQHMFLAKVLVGKMTIGRTRFCRPPRLNPRKSGYELYDTCVDRKRNPSIFVVFDSCQCYPYYLIKYKAVSGTVKIFV